MPPLPRLQAGPQSFGRRASPEDFGAGIGQAVQGAGALAGEIGGAAAQLALTDQRIREAETDARVDRAVAESAAEYARTVELLQQDPDLESHGEKLEKARAAIASQFGGQFDGRWREEYETRMVPVVAGAGAQVRTHARNAFKDRGVASLETALNTEADLGARSLDPDSREASRQRASGALERAVASGLLSASQAQARLERFDAEQTEALALSWIGDDPEGAREALRERSGGFERMREDARQRAIKSAEAEIRQRQQIAKAEQDEAEARAKEAQQKRNDEALKKLMAEKVDGVLTVGQVKAFRDALTPAQFDMMLDAATEVEARPADSAEVYRLESLRFTDPKAFAAETLDPKTLGPKKTLQLLEEQSKLRASGDFTPTTGRSFSDRLLQRLELLKGVDDEERAQLFRIGESNLEAFEREKGGKASPDEQQKVLDDVLTQRVIQKRSFGLSFRGAIGLQPDTVIQDDPLEAAAIAELTKGDEALTPENIALMRKILARRGAP